MASKWKAYKNNIHIEPFTKDKIIGDTSTKFLYGKVLDVGSEVTEVKVGDVLGYTQWGISKIIMADKSEHYFIKDDSDFILGVLTDEQ